MTLHVVTWFWRGWRPIYTWRHVNAIVRMLRPELPAAGRILCLSDQAQSSWMPAECEVAKLWANPVPQFDGHPNCFHRLRIFDLGTQRSLGIAPGDLVMSLDLDSLVLPGWSRLLNVMSCDNCLGMPEHGCYCEANGRPVPTFAAMGGLAARIHGSLFAFRAGTHADLWTDFDPIRGPAECRRPMLDGTMRPIGSDQAWMTRRVTGEHLWHQNPAGCYSWNRHGICMSPGRTANAVYWSFAGTNKPWSPLVQEVRPDLQSAYMNAYGEK